MVQGSVVVPVNPARVSYDGHAPQLCSGGVKMTPIVGGDEHAAVGVAVWRPGWSPDLEPVGF